MGEIFSTCIGWVGDVAEAITAQPLLLFGLVFSISFVAIGLFKRLFNI